ncbi:DUF7673 family protein [Collimonas silvisoli]|uniref:DUF7673 family protein n=1 Tax=Collimonas silvisoli TaxID=2825884 RepID=UPI001B8B57E4|nr:hypothetical protein [Collimonas silvisoli]
MDDHELVNLFDRELAVQPEGEAALVRLLDIAHRDSGQPRKVAAFLLGLYNGRRFPFNLTELRNLDRDIFNDCIAVLKMDYRPAQDVHCYFKRGGAIFEQLARDKDIPGADWGNAHVPSSRPK